jgi:hypothetical protein
MSKEILAQVHTLLDAEQDLRFLLVLLQEARYAGCRTGLLQARMKVHLDAIINMRGYLEESLPDTEAA